MVHGDSSHQTLHATDTEQISRVARALSVPKRVQILKLLGENNVMSVNEIAQALQLPISSASLHISVLEEVELLYCERMASIHGTMKMCSLIRDSVYFQLRDDRSPIFKQFDQSLPIGAYSQAESITAPCGLASQVGLIGVYNQPNCFYLPQRLDAQILWFRSGILCYRFAPLGLPQAEVEYLELSFEICTQVDVNAPVWESEIRVTINGCQLGNTICHCDSKGRRGTFNPSWWPDVATQHGELQKWRVTKNGTFLQGNKISSVTLDDLALQTAERINILLHVPQSAHSVGVNLFGTGFGDYNQALHLSIGYRESK